MLIDHMAKGYSFECFGAEVMVTEKTLYNWIDSNPDFLQSKKLGEKLCQKWWETLGRGLAAGKTQGNAAVYIFNMKNRFGWSDRRDLQVAGELKLNSITDLLIESGIDDDVIDVTPGVKQIENSEAKSSGENKTLEKET